MKRAQLIVTAYGLDYVAGDPEWLPHPVRIMGAAISAGERKLRRPGQKARAELIGGGVLAFGVVASSYAVAAGVIGCAYRVGQRLGEATEILLAWTCLAGRSLEVEASSVVRALETGDLILARGRLSRIVGRDTADLDACEISRAVVETVAESLSDGVMAPLFFLAAGGVPLAMAYKAANTLDSMIGHADQRYLYFGRVAARMDDVANLLPSRLTGLGITCVSAMTSWADGRSTLRIWMRDGSKHRSPNAGQPEAAMAGALGVRLGGVNFYGGERVEAAPMGAEFRQASPEIARRSIRLASAVTLAGVILVSVTLAALSGSRTRRA